MHRSVAPAVLLLALAALAACERRGGARAGGGLADTAGAKAAVPEIPRAATTDSAHPVVREVPMATAEYVVPPRGPAGGSGADFLVEWTADRRAAEPVIEAVMVGATGAQGISFVSVGRPLRRR